MVEHVNILDADRHEAKGASSALVGQYLMANGDGTTQFKLIDFSELANAPVSVGYEPILYSASNAASQQPTSLNIPVQIEFGAATSGGGVSLASNGTITFTEAGQYIVNINLRIGRTGGAGTARIFNRVLINGVPQLRPAGVLISSSDIVVPFSQSIPVSVQANDQLTFQVMRDGAGVNEGGLFQLASSAAGWDNSPSASVSIHKFGGLQ